MLTLDFTRKGRDGPRRGLGSLSKNFLSPAHTYSIFLSREVCGDDAESRFFHRTEERMSFRWGLRRIVSRVTLLFSLEWSRMPRVFSGCTQWESVDHTAFLGKREQGQ